MAIHQNKWGFRGSEITLDKPSGTLRVLLIGGSMTYNTSTDDETWADRLQELLAAANLDNTVEVLNLV